MRSIFLIKKNFKIISILLFVSYLQIFGREIVNKKLLYPIPNNLAKTSNSEYLSDIIEIPIKSANPFIAIGFNAELKSLNIESYFYLRVSEDGTKWTEWYTVNGEEEGSDINRLIAKLNFFNKENKYVQFKTNIFANIKSLTFSFISPGKTSASQITENLKKSNLVNDDERPAFVSRKSWGCPQSENVSSRSLTDVTHLIIHHSAGQTTSSDFAAVVLAYWDYHVNSNGWADIGYNWLVDPNGVLYKGRAWKSETEENVLGAHNSGKNGNTAGICFIGNYVSNIPSEIGLNKTAEISAFLCNKYGIDPLGTSYHAGIDAVNDNIDGHGQSGGGTACPGTQIINRLQVIRDKTFEFTWDSEAAPEIISTYPSAEQDSAYLSKDIIIEFTHPMDQTSAEDAFSIIPEVQGAISWNPGGYILYFKPSTPFTKMTNYKVTISNTAKSSWDLFITENYELNFITKANDNLSLISTFPQDGDVDVDLDETIEIIFDGPIAGSSLGGNISFVDEDSSSVGISVSNKDYENGIIRFTPTSSLNENSIYYIYLKDGIATTDDYILGKDITISFQTKNITSVDDINLTNNYELFPAYPNPFNPSTTIKYNLKSNVKSERADVKLVVYNVLGKEITTLVNQIQSPGSYEVTFDATDLPSGIYYYQLQARDYIETKKIILLK